ncbi:MAG: ABC transporter substrate-binding protein [Pseudonocardiales bacterium]|nr:ABC transporter substrate-binding protein [Pseudonocardiales bacterium]
MRASLRIGACLSLTGRFARFGKQAALGLRVWRALVPDAVTLEIADDESRPDRLRSELARLVGSADLVLGPYSTNLMRAAAETARDRDALVWNHGGSGDDVETSAPGHVVSVLAPTSRYAVPFVERVAQVDPNSPLWLRPGRGSFGRQVIDGAEMTARRLGVPTVRVRAGEPLGAGDERWNLFCAGSFEEDVDAINQYSELDNPPRLLGAVAAGVHEFARSAERCEGIYGIAQWARGQMPEPQVGPPEAVFLKEYLQRAGGPPDYPAVQAAAAAALANHCAQAAGSVARNSLWAAATALRTTTMFGPFAVDPVSGAQVAHLPVLLRWTSDGLVPVR